MNALKDLRYKVVRIEKGIGPKNQNYWKGQCSKQTPNPLWKIVNMVTETPWCMICQMLHSPLQHMVAWST